MASRDSSSETGGHFAISTTITTVTVGCRFGALFRPMSKRNV